MRNRRIIMMWMEPMMMSTMNLMLLSLMIYLNYNVPNYLYTLFGQWGTSKFYSQ
jgi:hypothetical protein